MLKSNQANNSYNTSLANNELERRNRIHQHELDLKLIAIQTNSMRTSNIIVAICTIAGAIVGALLMSWLQ